MADLVLYQFPGGLGLESLSPFCTKLAAYLRLAQFPYVSALGNPMQAPTGKLPYVRLDGALIGDSSVIVARLKDRFGDPLDGGLSERQRALGHLAQRMAEEHLYWGLLAVRWDDDAIWRATYRRLIRAALPPVLRVVLTAWVRRGVRKSLRAHGLGRHSRDAIGVAIDRDLASLEAILGEQPFLLGDAPSSYDCAVYAMLEHLRRTPGEHPVLAAFRARPALGAYCDRMNDRIGWPEPP